jgi:undecaprenol kinase
MNKVIISLRNAYIGLVYCFKTQRNMAIHTVAGILVLLLGIFLMVSLTELLFLLAAVFFVIVAEAFNTSIEKAIDLYTREKSELAKISKDVAAGAVLLTSFFAVLVGLVILGPPLWWFLTRLFL